MASATNNITELRGKVEELTAYLSLSHPSVIAALSDELEALNALVIWKTRDSKRITHDKKN